MVTELQLFECIDTEVLSVVMRKDIHIYIDIIHIYRYYIYILLIYLYKSVDIYRYISIYI